MDFAAQMKVKVKERTGQIPRPSQRTLNAVKQGNRDTEVVRVLGMVFQEPEKRADEIVIR